jgi:transcriptional regulator with XRE-family HTH domain
VRAESPAQPTARTPQAQLELIIAQLKTARRARRLTQQALADGLGVSALAVGAWETGKDTPALGNFLRWAEALGHTVTVTGAPTGDVLVPLRGESLEQFHLRRLMTALAGARERSNWSQEMVGDAIGVSAWTVHMWETGHRIPRLARLIEWCRALDCELTLVAR